ncbi:hypothetical protein CONPUDRAFT_128188 [Coniophora puteana RWD-64-598 SS2]|uniref:Transmembrane protein n=1 Tax=Coniophora puteana (strain RWD-64-598) TaxID=741705 RepID=A0A5M3MH09_CONPW|nr:uncharacterized protein CONPUDRAFT_128188 [Coniophora puteana RWD-64-598 SS2]EIW78518.1 hypothetical protein CONPUDRAFT_128188 [Coniophora puteana RWD-64-598 SS2]
MPDWSSQEELFRDTQVFVKLQHALLGLYAWEFLFSLDFEWALLTRKTKFKWPLMFYFVNRYVLLFALIGLAIALDTRTAINCRVLYAYIQFMGGAATGLSSVILSMHTIAIWSRNRWIVTLLALIIIGHWVVIFRGVILTANHTPGDGCQIVKEKTVILAAVFIYATCFDLIVFFLSGYKVVQLVRRKGNIGPQCLTKMMFDDGLAYFFCAFVVNVIAVVFMELNWNPIMGVIFNVPATVVSTIVASRVVRCLSDFSLEPEVIPAPSRLSSNLVFRTIDMPGMASRSGSTKVGQRSRPTSVHVEMETFSRMDSAEVDQHSDTGLSLIGVAVSTDAQNLEMSDA